MEMAGKQRKVCQDSQGQQKIRTSQEPNSRQGNCRGRQETKEAVPFLEVRAPSGWLAAVPEKSGNPARMSGWGESPSCQFEPWNIVVMHPRVLQNQEF